MTWPKVNLNNLCRPKQWPTIATNQMKDSGYPLYGANGKIGYYDKYTHEFPTLLITCRGATCGTINICEPFSYVNGNAMALDNLDEQQVALNFLYYYLNHRGLKDTISGSAQPQITRQGLSSIEIPLPPLEEQKRLAAILDQADELRRVRRAVLARLDELGQSLFIELFGDPTTNPKGWDIVRLKEVTTSLNGRRIPVESSIRATKAKIYRYYGASGVIDKIDDFIFNEETLLIGEDGANLLSRNSPIAFIVDGKYWVNNHAHVLKMRENIVISFLCFLVNHIDLKPYVTGSAQPKLNAANLANIQIPLPPLALQQQFAAQIEELEAVKTRAQASLTELDALFSSLQSRAFAGELSGQSA